MFKMTVIDAFGRKETSEYRYISDGLSDCNFENQICDLIDECYEVVNVLGVGEVRQSDILKNLYPDVFDEVQREELEFMASNLEDDLFHEREASVYDDYGDKIVFEKVED